VLREIRIHGRGGQGGVTAAQLIAEAAFREGKYVQAFPFFGAERRGAPVKAFARISDEPILLRSQIYHPDYVIILDPALPEVIDVIEGLKENGIIIVNSVKNPEKLGFNDFKVATVDATGISLKLNLLVAGAPVVNTPMLGAFVRATGEIKLESILAVIRERWGDVEGELNARAASLAYERLKMNW